MASAPSYVGLSLVFAAFSGVSACSIFSGVSDLQGGEPAPAPGFDAGGAKDAHGNTTDGNDAGGGSNGADASSDASHPSGPLTCGATTCDPGVPCCFDYTGRTEACGNANGACSGASVPLQCTSASDCATMGANASCCFSFTHGASCQKSCGGGDQALCDPNAASPCPAGQTCKPEPLIGGFSTCL